MNPIEYILSTFNFEKVRNHLAIAGVAPVSIDDLKLEARKLLETVLDSELDNTMASVLGLCAYKWTWEDSSEVELELLFSLEEVSVIVS